MNTLNLTALSEKLEKLDLTLNLTRLDDVQSEMYEILNGDQVQARICVCFNHTFLYNSWNGTTHNYVHIVNAIRELVNTAISTMIDSVFIITEFINIIGVTK